MGGKVKFHISDIMSALTGVVLSLPECSPINPDGTKWPQRDDRFLGILQLFEYVTGEEIHQPLDPVTKIRLYDGIAAYKLALATRTALQMQFPELANLSCPEFSGDQAAIDKNIIDWLKPLEKKYGEYLEVEAPEKKHTLAQQERRNTQAYHWGPENN